MIYVCVPLIDFVVALLDTYTHIYVYTARNLSQNGLSQNGYGSIYLYICIYT